MPGNGALAPLDDHPMLEVFEAWLSLKLVEVWVLLPFDIGAAWWKLPLGA